MYKYITIFLACYLAMALYFMFAQRRLMYFPGDTVPNRQHWNADDLQLIELKTEDGLAINSWYKPAASESLTIIYFQGNAGHIGIRMGLLRPFIDQGYGVLLIGYRGYNGNPGSPSEAGLYKDALAAVKFLQAAGVPQKKMVYWGESLGTAVAIETATKFPPRGLILQGAFSSMTEIAQYHYPYLPVRWFLWDKYESIAKISQLDMPMLFIHGESDQVTPLLGSKKLYAKANQPKKMVVLKGYGHNNLSGEEYMTQISEYLRRLSD